LNAHGRKLWLCVGDFNEVLLSSEKEGGQPKSQVCVDRFREALEECDLTDLGFSGDPFTWRNNSHTSENYIRERLDRAVANLEWRTRFPTARVVNGNHYHSDHRPVIVHLKEEVRCTYRGGGSPFRFEASWCRYIRTGVPPLAVSRQEPCGYP